MAMRVFVIGGSGLVGQNLTARFQAAGHDVKSSFHTSESDGEIQLDKCDDSATRQSISGFDPHVVIDTAAFHAVDRCETDRDRAWAVNATGTRNAAVAADQVNAHFIYFSTDYVFPGSPSLAPFFEDDPVAPVNYYAQTKYSGEQAARIAERVTVLRPSVIYGLSRDNFITWAMGELEAGNEIEIVDDQVSRPTYAPDIAIACVEIVENELTGLFHSAGPVSLSRYAFTRRFAEVFGYKSELISPISTGELGQIAPRPRDSSLDSSELYEAADVEFRSPTTAFEVMRANK